MLTFSEKPIDPNPAGKHEIHSAFQLTAEEYDKAKAFLASKGVEVFKEEDRRAGTFQGRVAYFLDPDANLIELWAPQHAPVRRPRTVHRAAGRRNVLGNGEVGDLIAEKAEFGLDPAPAPGRVFSGHATDQCAELKIERRVTH